LLAEAAGGVSFEPRHHFHAVDKPSEADGLVQGDFLGRLVARALENL
jgi:hypothetical protein